MQSLISPFSNSTWGRSTRSGTRQVWHSFQSWWHNLFNLSVFYKPNMKTHPVMIHQIWNKIILTEHNVQSCSNQIDHISLLQMQHEDGSCDDPPDLEQDNLDTVYVIYSIISVFLNATWRRILEWPTRFGTRLFKYNSQSCSNQNWSYQSSTNVTWRQIIQWSIRFGSRQFRHSDQSWHNELNISLLHTLHEGVSCKL